MKIQFGWEVVNEGQQVAVTTTAEEARAFARDGEAVRALEVPDIREWPDVHAGFRTTTGAYPSTPEGVVGCW